MSIPSINILQLIVSEKHVGQEFSLRPDTMDENNAQSQLRLQEILAGRFKKISHWTSILLFCSFSSYYRLA